MDDEDLRLAAGRAMGLSVADLNFFAPLQCNSQTLQIAAHLNMVVDINFQLGKTTVTKPDCQTPIVELHESYADPSLATRYAVVRMAALVGLRMPLVERVVPNTLPPDPALKAYKHGKKLYGKKPPLVVNE